MKKFTSILMLLLACVGTAWAQAQQGGQTEALKKHDTSTWTITGNSEDGREGTKGGLIKHATDGNTNTYWHSNWGNDTTAPHWILIDTKTPVDIKQIDYTPRQDLPNGAWFHCKVYASDTNFNITTPSNNKAEKDKVLALTNPVADVAVCASNADDNTKKSKKYIKLNTTKAYQYYLIAITESQRDNVGTHATAAEIEFFTGNTATVTYKYVLDNVEKKTITRNELIGSLYTVPEDIPFVRESVQGTVTAGANNVTVTCVEELPFVKTTDANEKCYAINIKPASKPYFWQYTADNTNLTISEKGYDANGLSTMDESFLWYFKGNAFDGFEIYNKKAGATKTLSSGNGDPKVTTETTKTKWFLHTADNGVAFKASNTNYINFHEHTKTLSYWNKTDGGSSCRFYKPADFVLQQSISLKNAPANAVGGKEGAEKLDNASVSANHFDFAAAKALATAITQLKDNAPLTSGGYYRIVSAVPNFIQNQHVYKAFYLDEASKFIKWKTLSNSEVGQVFQIVASNTQGKYKIKNCNAKQFMQGPRGGLNDAGADVTLAKLDLTQYNIKFGNEMCHAESHGNGSGQSGALIPYTAVGLNSASAWYIVNADDIEVALHDGADKSGTTAAYGTAYLPFAVSKVASQDGSVKMYTGEYKTNHIALTDASTNGVAAENAILLKGNAGTTKATLTISDGTAQSMATSKGMTGTLTQIAKPTTGTVLTLGRSKTAPNAVGFYVFDGQNLRANSAYIHVTNQAATGLSLVFDGEATDIESVETADKADNQPLFDLTGRRVMQTVKGGIYIKANGEKYIAR